MHFKRTNGAKHFFFLILQPVCNVNISVSISPLAQIIIQITLTYFGDATFYMYQNKLKWNIQ
jgi:hypothetical protein